MNTFFASIVVGLMYSVFSANTTYDTEFAAYNFLYTFSFSMILGELIRATKGRTIYIRNNISCFNDIWPLFSYLAKKSVIYFQLRSLLFQQQL